MFTKRVAMKVNDRIPESGASCDSKRRGPTKKNLLVPKALVPTLNKNARRGNAWVKSVKTEVARPRISFGKNPSKAMMIANDM